MREIVWILLPSVATLAIGALGFRRNRDGGGGQQLSKLPRGATVREKNKRTMI